MASPGLGLLLALGLLLLPADGGQTLDTTVHDNSTTTPSDPGSAPMGGLSQGAITAITVVFSLLAAVLLALGLWLLVQKLREKWQTEDTYRQRGAFLPRSRCPGSKETVQGYLPI